MIGPAKTLLNQHVKELTKYACMMDERGYAIVVDRGHLEWAYGHRRRTQAMLGGFISLMKKVTSNGVIVYVQLNKFDPSSGIVYPFTCRISERVAYKPIHSALFLMSSEEHTSGLHRTRINGRSIQYYGSTRDALHVLVGVLDMPEHRKILTSPRRR